MQKQTSSAPFSSGVRKSSKRLSITVDNSLIVTVVISLTVIVFASWYVVLQPAHYPIVSTHAISVSPSGRMIAFQTYNEISSTRLPKWLHDLVGSYRDSNVLPIWVYSFDEKLSRQLLADSNINFYSRSKFAWSPNETSFLYKPWSIDSIAQLSQFDMIHQRSNVLAHSSDRWIENFQFNPNGQYFCFVHNSDDKILELHDLGSNTSSEIARGIYYGEWLWSRDGTKLFYSKLKASRKVSLLCETSLATRKERVLFRIKTGSLSNNPNIVTAITPSPDGRLLGFLLNSGLHSLDLDTLQVSQLLEIDDLMGDSDWIMGDFDWNESGICFLAPNSQSQVRLQIYDPESHMSRIIARGPIQRVKWLNANQIVTRYDNKFIVLFDVTTGRATTLFDPTDITNTDQVALQPTRPTTGLNELSPPFEVVQHAKPVSVANPAMRVDAVIIQPKLNNGAEKLTVRSLDEMLTFFPSKYPQGNWTPPDLDFEDCWFTTEDNVKLHGWYCRHPEARAVVLFAHGNAGNLAGRAPVLKLLNEQLQLSVLIFDYRGYGQSKGTPTVKGVLLDARAARTWLAEREQIESTDIVLLGRSLGGGVMVDLAASDGARGLILESTFTSLRDVAEEMYPKWMVHAVMRNKLNSHGIIADYSGPLLISHGDSDTVIPFAHGQSLFEAANEPKTFFKLDGTDHNDSQTGEYFEALSRFIDSL